MKSSIISILLCIVIFCCNDDDVCLIGSGTVNTYPVETVTFNNVSISGPINLRYTQGNTQDVSITAEPEMFDQLDYYVKDNTLHVGYIENITCFETVHGVWVNVIHPEISNFEAQGKNQIVSDGPINQPYLSIDASGMVTVDLTGKVEAQTLSVSGELRARNFGLESKRTFIEVSGTGEIEVTCTDSLDIEVSGSSTVYYQGYPIITQEVDGTLVLQDAN